MSASPKATVGLYGGSFDPPHLAHVFSVGYAMSALALDAVWVVPSFERPLDKAAHLPFPDRLALTQLAMAPFSAVRVLDLEARLPRPSYTLRTVEALQSEHPSTRFRLLLGSDLLGELPRWHKWSALARKTAPVILRRAGHPVSAVPEGCSVLPLELPKVSSSALRSRLAEGILPDGLIPAAAAQVIRERGLYQAPPAS